MKTRKDTKQLMKQILIFAFMGIYIMSTACSGGKSNSSTQTSSSADLTADYGDAPDNLADGYGGNTNASFPTRASSNGAHHLDTTKIALGMIDDLGEWPNSAEEDAIDPNDPDGIQNIDEEPGESNNDDYDDGLLTYTFEDDSQGNLQFAVTAASDSPQTTYYLNVLFDWNKDGKWEGQDSNGAEEWAVKNFKVDIQPGEEKVFRTDDFETGEDAHPVWVRLTLSEEPIDEADFPNGWDGTGEFELGETEDYLLDYDEVINMELEDGSGLPGVPVNPFNPKPIPPIGGGGGSTTTNNCEYNYYLRMTVCEGKSIHKLLTIGGFAPDSLQATSSDSSIASVSLNEANVTITGNEEGYATITLVATQGRCTYYVTIMVHVKKCEKKKKEMIDCCGAEQIKRDPSRCKNCKVVGRQYNQTNTFGGGGTIPETAMEGRKTNVSKSYVLHRGGGVVDVITIYYECHDCDTPEDCGCDGGEEDEDINAWLDDLIDDFFDAMADELFGGDNGVIDDWFEYEEMVDYYDSEVNETWYECASRYFYELEMEM